MTVYQIHDELQPFIYAGSNRVRFESPTTLKAIGWLYTYEDAGIPYSNVYNSLNLVKVGLNNHLPLTDEAPTSFLLENFQGDLWYEFINPNLANNCKLVIDIFLSTDKPVVPFAPGPTIMLPLNPQAAPQTLDPSSCDCPLSILLSQGWQQPLLHT